MACTRPTRPSFSITLMPWGWDALFVRIRATMPSVCTSVGWFRFSTIHTRWPGRISLRLGTAIRVRFLLSARQRTSHYTKNRTRCGWRLSGGQAKTPPVPRAGPLLQAFESELSTFNIQSGCRIRTRTWTLVVQRSEPDGNSSILSPAEVQVNGTWNCVRAPSKHMPWPRLHRL